MNMSKKIDVSAMVTLIKDFDFEMLNDTEWNELKKVEPSNKGQMLETFNQFMVPEFEAMDSRSQDLIKSSLIGVLTSSDFDFQQILEAVEMPFEPIENPKEFFSILWLALFKEIFSG